MVICFIALNAKLLLSVMQYYYWYTGAILFRNLYWYWYWQ